MIVSGKLWDNHKYGFDFDKKELAVFWISTADQSLPYINPNVTKKVVNMTLESDITSVISRW